MATRSYADIARKARAGWSPEGRDLSERLGAELRAEVAAEIQLGQQLALARQAAHLTQEELSVRAAVSQADISRIERGLGNPTRDTLVKLVAAMGARLTVEPASVPSGPSAHRSMPSAST